MSEKLVQLQANLETALGKDLLSSSIAINELTIEVPMGSLFNVCKTLRDDSACLFEQLVDLCGMDYSSYKNEVRETQRFAVVIHLLSLTHNTRIRVRSFCVDDDFPVSPSVIDIMSVKRLTCTVSCLTATLICAEF